MQRRSSRQLLEVKEAEEEKGGVFWLTATMLDIRLSLKSENNHEKAIDR